MGPSLFVNSPGGSTRVRSTCFSRPAVLIISLPSNMGWCGQYDRTAWAHGTLTPCITGSRCQPLRLSCLLRILGMCFVKAPAGVLLGCLPPSSVYRAIAKVALAGPMTRDHIPLKRADVLLLSADIASVSRLQAISFLSILHAICQQQQAKPCTLRRAETTLAPLLVLLAAAVLVTQLRRLGVLARRPYLEEKRSSAADKAICVLYALLVASHAAWVVYWSLRGGAPFEIFFDAAMLAVWLAAEVLHTGIYLAAPRLRKRVWRVKRVALRYMATLLEDSIIHFLPGPAAQPARCTITTQREEGHCVHVHCLTALQESFRSGCIASYAAVRTHHTAFECMFNA